MSKWAVPLILIIFAAANFAAVPLGDPAKGGGDEARLVMTGVFFRDALYDLPDSLSDPKGYASRYYAQYPALGLLVWPPLFHAAEGLAMAAFGTSYLVARLVVLAFALFGGCYAYRLAKFTHGPRVARLALALFLAARMAFDFSAYALAEIPCLALILASIFHFERYLRDLRGRDAIAACMFAALAALTRYNGMMLLIYVPLRLTMTWNWKLLIRRPVVIGVLLGVALTLPYYLFALQEYGGGIRDAAVKGTNAEATSFLDIRNFYYYPYHLIEQAGWPLACLGIVGFVLAPLFGRYPSGPHLGLMAATYLFAVPFAEPVPRHAIYWLPAIALFAAALLDRLRNRLPILAMGIRPRRVGLDRVRRRDSHRLVRPRQRTGREIRRRTRRIRAAGPDRFGVERGVHLSGAPGRPRETVASREGRQVVLRRPQRPERAIRRVRRDRRRCPGDAEKV